MKFADIPIIFDDNPISRGYLECLKQENLTKNKIIYLNKKSILPNKFNSLINFKKGKVNSKENALSAIKFFDLPEVKTTLSVMISNHLKVVKGLDKIRNATEATIIDNDEIDKNLEKLFKETEKIGAPFNFKKKK